MKTNVKRVNFAKDDDSQDAADPKVGLLPGDMDPEHKKRLAELELKLQRRRDCEDRAYRIVLRLLDNPVTEQFLTDAAQFLHLSHYRDVTEERAITQLCGYPLCLHALPKQPKKKYHISLAHKKVYDITERKNFCNNQCFKASKHFEEQICPTAVWAREGEPPIDFHVLSLDGSINCGSVGEEVMTDPSAHVRLELEALEDSDRRVAMREAAKLNPRPTLAGGSEVVRVDQLVQQVSDMLLIGVDEEEAGGGVDEGETLKPNSQANMDLHDEGSHDQGAASGRAVNACSSEPLVPMSGMVPMSGPVPVSCPDPPHYEQETHEGERVKDGVNSKAELLTALLDQREALQDSITVPPLGDPTASGRTPVGPHKAIRSAFGASVLDNIHRVEMQSKAALRAKARKKSRQVVPVPPLVLVQNCLLGWRTAETSAYLRGSGETGDMSDFDKKYAALGARVGDLSGMVGESGMDDGEVLLNPVPEMKQLQQETRQLELKVTEFYRGSMRYLVLDADTDPKPDPVPDAGPDSSAGEEVPLDGEKPESEPVLPLLDAYSQTAIRRKIVFDQLNRVLPDLLRPLSLSLQDVASDLRQLVNTFSFSAANLVLKPREWTLIAFFLLRLLALRISVVEAAFQVPNTKLFFARLITSLGITEPMIQSLLQDVMSPTLAVMSPHPAVMSLPVT